MTNHAKPTAAASVLAVLILIVGSIAAHGDNKETFVIRTSPEGARAALSNGLSCTTPCELRINRRDDFLVTLEKEGYEMRQVRVVSVRDSKAGGMRKLINVFGVPTGGYKHVHYPNPLIVDLQPVRDGIVPLPK